MIENDDGTVRGETDRLGTTLLTLGLEPTGKAFEVPDTFPRLFWKVIPQADRPEALGAEVVRFPVETVIDETVWGDGSIEVRATDADPLDELGSLEVLGASLVKGSQVRPWGEVIS